MSRRGFGLVEVVLAVLVLAMAVGPLVGLFRAGRKLGVSEDALLGAHLKARALLQETLDRIEQDGVPAAKPIESDEVSVAVERETELPGLCRVTVSCRMRAADGKVVPYTLARLVRSSRAVAGEENAK